MKKIWIGAGLACVLSLAGCGGGEKTEAPKTAHHKKLPKTATPLPLLELAGALSMAAGYGVRRLRKA